MFRGKHATLALLKIETQTRSLYPSDRTRKTLGVAEIVDLTLKPELDQLISWTKTGGFLQCSSKNTAYLVAPHTADPSSVTVTASVGGRATCSVDFTLVEPTGVHVLRHELLTEGLAENVSGAGMNIYLAVMPTNVSFGRLETMEVGRMAVNVTGYFTNSA